MIKIEDIIFWILISAIVAIALWLLSGSPPEIDALITIALFVAASEMLICRKIFSIEKNTTIGFMRVKHDLDVMRKEMNFQFINLNDRFDNLDSKLNVVMRK